MMKLSRLTTSNIVSRRKTLVAGLLVAIAGGGGLAARAWQDTPLATQNSQMQNFPAQKTSPATSAPQVVQTQIQGQRLPGIELPPSSGNRFPTQTRIATEYPTQHIVGATRTSPFFAPAESRESAELSKKIGQLLGKLRGSPENKSELQQELEVLLAKQFDQKHDSQSQQLDKLKASLAEAEKTLADREQNRDRIIERRLNELLGESDKYAWEYQQRFDSREGLRSQLPSASNIFGVSPRPYTQYVPVPGGVYQPPTANYAQPTAPSAPSAPAQLPPSLNAPGTTQPRRLAVPLPMDSSAEVLKEELDAAKRELEDLKRLYSRNAISSSELAKAQSQLRIAGAKLNSSIETLKLQVETARIDLETEQAELQLLQEESRSMKDGTTEAYKLRRELARAKANLQKAELQLAQQMQQLERLTEAAKPTEAEQTDKAEDVDGTAAPDSGTISIKDALNAIVAGSADEA